MIGRVTDQTMMLHGLKDVNTRDVLKLHGFNKDKPGLREFEFNYLVDDIYTFSDETFIVVNHTAKVMWLSYYDKTINVPFSYTNCFKFYEEEGVKYCIAYVSGDARCWSMTSLSDWEMSYNNIAPNILFCKYRLTYDIGNPKFTLTSSTTINDVDAHMKVKSYIPRNTTGTTTVKRPYTFEYDNEKNQLIFFDWGNGSSPPFHNAKYGLTCDIFMQDLNTRTLRDYRNIYSTTYDKSTSRIITRSSSIGNVMLFWYNYRNGSDDFDDFSRVLSLSLKNNRIEASEVIINANSFDISNHGQDSNNTIQGACFYRINNSQMALGEFYTRWVGLDDRSAYLCYTGWSCPNIGQRTSIITLQDEYDILLNDENNIIATADKQHNMTFPGYTLKELVISDLMFASTTPTNAGFYIYLGTIPFLTIQYNSISINYRMGYSTPAYSTITSGLSPRTSRLTITLKIVSSTSMRLDIRSVNKTSGVVNTYTQNLTLTAQNLSILSQYVEFRKFNIDGYSYTYDVSQEYTDDSKTYEVKRFPVGNMPQAFTCNTVANLPVGYKQAYKYNKRLSNDNINYQLLMSSKKQENPQTLYTHSIYTLQDYEMDVEINRQQYDGFDWTRIIFKDEQGNTVPHFMEPRQPNGTVIFVLKVNLKAGWNVFTFEQGSVLTNQLSKGTAVFSKFFNLTAGKPSGWTIPSGYEFNSTNGLIKGSTNQYTEEFINTGIYPQIGMRYEIGFGNYLDDRGNNGTYGGYYQFGQFDRNFWRQSVLTQNMDGVRGQTTYGNSDNRHGPRHATVDMRTNTISSGRIAGHRAGSQWRYEYCDTISGFEMGKDRVLAYSYLQTGRSSRFVAYTGWGNNVIGPYIPSTENGYGITRTPDLTKPIKLLSLYYIESGNYHHYNQILYIRERKAWQGETTTAGYKNTYLIKAGSKYYLDVPF